MRWLAIPVIVVLLLLVIPPLLYLFQASITESDVRGNIIAYTLEHFRDVLGTRKLFAVSMNSLVYSAGSTVVALLIGSVIAWIVERTNAPLKAFSYFTAVLALATPYVLYVEAWILLFGKAGPVNQLYRDLTGSTDLLFNIYSLPGMILVEGFLWSPLSFLLIGSSLRNMNPELEEAARMSGAGIGSTLRIITLRLALPAVMALAMLVFIRAIESFEVPALVGVPGRIYVLTSDIYSNMLTVAPPDLGGASALSVFMLVLMLGLLYVYSRLSRHAERFATITGKGFRPRPLDLGPWRYPVGAIQIVNFLFLLALPTAILVWASLLPFYQQISTDALRVVTLKNYRTVISGIYVPPVINTLLVSFGTAIVTMALTMIGSWLVVRRGPGASIIDRLAMTPLIFPALVLGISVMELFIQIPLPIYGTLWILLWAYVTNFLPIGMRYNSAGIMQIHRELEEAATICGASPVTRLTLVVMPLLTPTLIAGGLFVFLAASRSLSLAVLLSNADTQLMSIQMFNLWVNGQGPELAALGLIWTLCMGGIAALFFIVARRSSTGVFGSG